MHPLRADAAHAQMAARHGDVRLRTRHAHDARGLSVDLVPTNGKRMVYLDNMSPRGQEQASHALYGACGRFGEPLGASWGLRRASNGLEHGLPARTVKRFGTVSVQVLGVAPRGFPLAEKSLPTAQGTCGRLSAAAGSRARALWALRVAILAPHELIVYRSFRSELSSRCSVRCRK